MPEPEKLLNKDIADILFKKYSLLKAEIHLHMTNYKRQAKSVQLISTAVFAAASYLIVENKFAPTDSNIWIWGVGLILAMCLLCFFVYDILDSLYDINVLGERMLVLERQINEVAGRTLLIWETEISGKVHSQKPFPGVTPPFIALQLYVFIMTALALLVFPIATAIYLLLNAPITNHVALKYSLLATDILWAIASAAILVYVVLGQYKARKLAKELMQEVASRTWRPIDDDDIADGVAKSG